MDLLLASVALFCAQLVRGVTGFGQAMVALAPLVMLFGAQEALFIAAITNTLAGLVLIPGAWRQMRLALLAAVWLPLVLGQNIGTELLVTLPETTVRVALGVIIAAFGASVLVRPVREGRGEAEDLPERPTRTLAVAGLAGFAGGISGGLTGVDGPPIVLTLRHVFTDHFVRAQLIGIFTASAASLSALLWLKGAATPGSLTKALWLMPALAGGALVGQRLAGKLSPVHFGRLVGLLLTLAGLSLLAPP